MVGHVLVTPLFNAVTESSQNKHGYTIPSLLFYILSFFARQMLSPDNRLLYDLSVTCSHLICRHLNPVRL